MKSITNDQELSTVQRTGSSSVKLTNGWKINVDGGRPTTKYNSGYLNLPEYLN